MYIAVFLKMNIEQANNLDFPDVLSRLGHEPAKTMKGGTDLWYFSPLRTEKEPSFHVRHGHTYDWVWHDFGHGGTTLVQFICELQNCDTKAALKFLRDMYPDHASRVGGRKHQKKDPTQPSLSFPQHSTAQPLIFHNKAEDLRDLEFIGDKPLTSKTVLTYLEGRRIAPEVSQRYFRLIQYKNKKSASERLYFGFGMKNQSDGWELRSASDDPNLRFKSALIARDITVVNGTDQSRGVNIFEGQMDFVSLLMMIGTNHLVGDTIILNGLQSYGRAKAYIEQSEYESIHTFLDNDDSGRKTTAQFVEDFGDRVINQSPSFAPHKDVNLALKAGHVPQFMAKPEPPSFDVG